ncbi:serine/threonine-protein kinase BLUS1-like [Vicia villosa]|uniref:serine/threonine-protein kinase BLUS1-like n=1 Tax=Vicia villosa TaxID=3911 RepID=UPI00273C21A2|nr:serine/threonine-protein kinase BLUS1-like [Vicia villosa]
MKTSMASNIAERVQYPLDSSSYKIIDEIGAGNSAVVYKAICIPVNSTPVAIKSIDLDRSRPDLDDVRREAKTLSLLSHPNILKAHCSFTMDHRLWVVMPFMAGGSLQSIISHSFQNGLSEQSIAVILKDTLNALSYLHGQGHLHRDIKSGNILVDSNGLVKLADFGVSASIYESNNSVGVCSSYSSSSSNSSSSLMFTDFAGTPYWMAPEVIHSHNGYSFKADIWSFGITALELAHGRPPLSHLPPSKSMMLNITKRFRFSDFDKYIYKGSGGSNKFSKAFKDMVASCLNQDPTKRPSAEKLLKHSFFKNCKGPEFLVKNVLNGLPSVEKRYKEIKVTMGADSKENDDDGDDEDSVVNVKQRRISGWNFNEDGLKLEPVFPKDQCIEDHDVVKQVRFEEENAIQEEEDVASSGTVIETSPNDSDVVELDIDDVSGVVKNREATLATLSVLKGSLEQELGQVKFLMSLIGGNEEESHVAESEEKTVQEISKLRMELETERKKNLQLELQLENIKLHLISSTVNSPTS